MNKYEEKIATSCGKMCSSLNSLIYVNVARSFDDGYGMMNTLPIFFIPTKYDPVPLMALSNPLDSLISNPETADNCLILVRNVFVCMTQIPCGAKIYNSVSLALSVMVILECACVP